MCMYCMGMQKNIHEEWECMCHLCVNAAQKMSANSAGILDGKPIVGSLWVFPQPDGSPGNLYRVDGYTGDCTQLSLCFDLQRSIFNSGHIWNTYKMITEWELYSLPKDNTTKAIEERKNGCICVLGRSRFCTVHKE